MIYEPLDDIQQIVSLGNAIEYMAEKYANATDSELQRWMNVRRNLNADFQVLCLVMLIMADDYRKAQS